MASLVDVPLDGGNAERVIKELTAPDPTPTKVADNPAPAAPTGKIDPRFVGKSVDDVIDMYRNLESHSGRLASDLGNVRRTVDELIADKRQRDLGNNTPRKPDMKVEPADLFQNPQETLSEFVAQEADRRTKPLVDKVAQLEQALAGLTFTGRHPDYNEVTSNQEFKDWAGKTPLRTMTAQRAGQGDVGAADALLTEWKAQKPIEASRDRVVAAEKIGFESGRASSDNAGKTAGKTYRRSDLIKLNMTQPDKYEELGDAITRAYAEGRVDINS